MLMHMYKSVFVLTSNRVSGESVSSDEVKDVVQDSINSQQNTHKQSQRCNLQEGHNLHERHCFRTSKNINLL